MYVMKLLPFEKIHHANEQSIECLKNVGSISVITWNVKCIYLLLCIYLPFPNPNFSLRM